MYIERIAQPIFLLLLCWSSHIFKETLTDYTYILDLERVYWLVPATVFIIILGYFKNVCIMLELFFVD